MTEKLERILKFVLQRSKPVTAKIVAQQFLIAQSTAATHLRHLHEAGHITRQQVKKQIVWGKKSDEPFMPVAVPEASIAVQPRRSTTTQWEQPKPIWPDNPFKTSYPNVRGYDD